jgi:hypothetical protein
MAIDVLQKGDFTAIAKLEITSTSASGPWNGVYSIEGEMNASQKGQLSELIIV